MDDVKNVYKLQEHINARFHEAVAENKLVKLVKFLRKGAKINSTNNKLLTAAQLAITFGHHDVLRLLALQRTFDVHSLNIIDGKNLFQCACIQDDFKSLKILFLNYKIEMEYYADPFHRTLLHYCAKYNSIKIFRALLKPCYDFDVNVVNRLEQTPLHVACKQSNAEIVRILLKRNDIQIYLTDAIGFTVVHEAIRQGHRATLNHLINPPKFYHRTISKIDGRNIIEFACIKDDVLTVQMLLKHKFITYKDHRNRTLLHYCGEHNSREICKSMVAQASVFTDINAVDTNTGRTALHEACLASNFEIVQLLFKCTHIRTDLIDSLSRTAFDYACRYDRNLSLVRFLIGKCVDLNLKESLEIASKSRAYVIVKELSAQPNLIVDLTSEYMENDQMELMRSAE